MEGKETIERPGFKIIGEFAGHTFYVWERWGEMPKIRQMAYFAAIEDVRLSLSRKEMLAYKRTVEEIILDKSKPDHVKLNEISQINNYFGYLIELPTTQEPLAMVGMVCTLMDDEPADELNQEWAEKKYLLMNQAEAIKGFFLQVGWSVTDISAENLNGTEEWDYTKVGAMDRIEKVFLEKIGKYYYSGI